MLLNWTTHRTQPLSFTARTNIFSVKYNKNYCSFTDFISFENFVCYFISISIKHILDYFLKKQNINNNIFFIFFTNWLLNYHMLNCLKWIYCSDHHAVFVCYTHNISDIIFSSLFQVFFFILSNVLEISN